MSPARWSSAEVVSTARMIDGPCLIRRARVMRCCSPLSLQSSRGAVLVISDLAACEAAKYFLSCR